MNVEALRHRLISTPRPWKQVVLVAGDAVLLLAALFISLCFVAQELPEALRRGSLQFPLALLVALPMFGQAGFYRTITRFPGSHLLVTTGVVLVATALVMAFARSWAPGEGFELPRSTLPSFAAIALLAVVSSRLLMRSLLLGRPQMPGQVRTPVVIYGAGNAGVRLLTALNEGGRFRPVAVVDDNVDLHGRLLAGVRVWPPAEVPRLARDHGARRVLLAMPSISRARRQAIIDELVGLNVRVQTVPDVGDIITGTARVDDLREVDALDLLGRDPVPPNQRLLGACVTGKTVLVTGAGGSIGSELCRQIVQLEPERLIVLDISEYALYEIERELRAVMVSRNLDLELVALLGSVHHRPRMRSVMRAYGVQTVYHAAAYKHVPIVEQNMIEGVHNNIIGTWYTAEAAEEAGVETFVLVSTDKAVLPTSVMGATKRVAELALQGMARRGTNTRFCMVRFGNVLDSSGSVVPLFRDQILRGGPVTVTDPEVTRYFMTIPEAAQLVIQASAMCEGGDVFVLDMGQPVRIADLARRMIRLMGRSVRGESNPGGDIALEFTGLRPGEKLYEELLLGNDVRRTEHAMIMRAMEESLPWPETRKCLDSLLAAADALDCEQALGLLRAVVRGYQPDSLELYDLAWSARNRDESEQVAANLGLVETAASAEDADQADQQQPIQRGTAILH